MIVSSIVAVSENDVIGVDNDLPWRLPSDLKFFKETTHGHHILLGRKNYESIGRPLPGRTNVVVTRNKDFYHSALIIKNDLPSAIEYSHKAGEKELFIIGGEQIYSQTMALWDRLYLTRVHTEIENGTAFFRDWDPNEWQLVSSEKKLADKKNPYDHTFMLYERKK